MTESKKRNQRRYTTAGSKGVVPFPKYKSEFEVQSDLFERLKVLGFNVRGEVKYEVQGHRGMRFDLVVYNSDNIAELVIEVKNGPSGKKPTKQSYYRQMSCLPVVVFFEDSEISSVINELKRLKVKSALQEF